MNGFLLDTNIPSEMTRPSPEPSVAQWLEDADNGQLYISVISLGGILKGIVMLPESKRRNHLRQWLAHTLRPWFEGRVLPVNESIAERWGVLDEAAVVLDEDEEHAARDRAVATTATPAAATCCLRRNGISGTPYGF